jgi:hypothetical protein
METMFSLLGVDLSSVANLASEYEGYQQRGEQIKAASEIYKKATAMLNSQLTDNASEAKFIQTVARALRYWATSDDDQVYVVSFGSRGKYDVLQFSQASLLPAMKDLKLRARFIPGDNPKIEVYDANSNQMLFSIRTYVQQQQTGSYQRNVIEKGPLLGKVADATGRYQDRPKDLEKQNTVPQAQPAQTGQVIDKQQSQSSNLSDKTEKSNQRLTGPGAKAATRPVEPRMTTEVLGRELRRR